MKNIIVIPFNVPWNWSTDYLNQTALEISKRGDLVICYLCSEPIYFRDIFFSKKSLKIFTKYSTNIYLFKPLYIIPGRRFIIIANINSWLNAFALRIYVEILALIKHITAKVFWIFDPNLIYIYSFFSKKYFFIYDCVDFFAVGAEKNILNTQKHEQTLCKNADLVVANSKVLQKHLSTYRRKVFLVPQGFRNVGFVVGKNKKINLKIKRPVVGFVGGINNRLDTDILEPLITSNPNWNFVLWGPFQKNIDTGSDRLAKISKILDLPNVYSGESTNKEDIPTIISQFDIGMIPYDISQQFNKYCYPMKFFEYIYLYKPVISTPIEELKRFPQFVNIAKNTSEWQFTIETLLKKTLSAKDKQSMRTFADENSWSEKVSKIYNLFSFLDNT